MAVATLADLSAAVSGAESTLSAQAEGWKQQTVGDFFARCNWENLEVPVPTAMGANPAVAFDYNRSVGQFFGAIPWAGGAAAIATQLPTAETRASAEQSGLQESPIDALPELEEIADESHLDGGEVTLDDFLGSFSL